MLLAVDFMLGESNTRLATLKTDRVADMTPITDDVANLKVDMVDRITAIEDKLKHTI